MEALRLEKKIPPSMRGGFWTAFMDAVDLELQNLKAQSEVKKGTYNVAIMDFDQLIDISNLLGVAFNATVNSDPEFLRREVAEIPFKIQYKATAVLYESFIKALEAAGGFYVYYFRQTSGAILRNIIDPLTYIDQFVNDNGYDVPFFVASDQNFSGQIGTFIKLDTGRFLDNVLDPWTLDVSSFLLSTNHIGLEFFLGYVKPLQQPFGFWDATVTYAANNKVWWNGAFYFSIAGSNTNHLPSDATRWTPYVINEWNSATTYTTGQHVTVDGIYYRCTGTSLNEPPVTTPAHWTLETLVSINLTMRVGDPTLFLLNNDYFDYLYQQMTIFRRVKEVPHVGAQLALLTDSSNKIDSGSVSRAYSVPSIRTNVLTTPDWTTLLAAGNVRLHLVSVAFGIGTHTGLPKQAGGGTMPTALAQRVATTPLLFDETGENVEWAWAGAQYPGQQVNDLVLHDSTGYVLANGTGSGAVNGTNHAFSGKLLFSPVKPLNLNFFYTFGGATKKIVDDGLGHLVGGNASGTINYQTGEYSFDTVFDFIDNYTRQRSDIDIANDLHATLPISSGAASPLIKHTGSDHVWLTFQIAGHVYQIPDDGAGNFLLTGKVSGTINYTTGAVVLHWTILPDTDAKINFQYKYQRNFTPDAATTVEVDYYFTDTVINITEVGLYGTVAGNLKLLAYATFPPVEFHSSRYHLSFELFISKTTFA